MLAFPLLTDYELMVYRLFTVCCETIVFFIVAVNIVVRNLTCLHSGTLKGNRRRLCVTIFFMDNAYFFKCHAGLVWVCPTERIGVAGTFFVRKAKTFISSFEM